MSNPPRIHFDPSLFLGQRSPLISRQLSATLPSPPRSCFSTFPPPKVKVPLLPLKFWHHSSLRPVRNLLCCPLTPRPLIFPLPPNTPLFLRKRFSCDLGFFWVDDIYSCEDFYSFKTLEIENPFYFSSPGFHVTEVVRVWVVLTLVMPPSLSAIFRRFYFLSLKFCALFSIHVRSS